MTEEEEAELAEARREEEERRAEKYRKMEEERETMRQGIRDKVFVHHISHFASPSDVYIGHALLYVSMSVCLSVCLSLSGLNHLFIRKRI